MPFHRCCGDRVTLLNNNETATRNFVEFNHGVILSADPLEDEKIFEVRIDKMVTDWDGSLEIGVTSQDPETIELLPSATRLTNSAWLLTGNCILKDGLTVNYDYGPNLENCGEGDNIGVMRSEKGELKFYINGHCLGVAATNLPQTLYAVVNLYGKCVQVTINNTPNTPSLSSMALYCGLSLCSDPKPGTSKQTCAHIFDQTDTMSTEEGAVGGESLRSQNEGKLDVACGGYDVASDVPDPLRFHPRCGAHVLLTNSYRSAERIRPLEDYNNGVVMTHRPLGDEEIFEVKVERLIEKWSGGVEIGLTIHNPAEMSFPNTMTNMSCGTAIMSGSKILINGQATGVEYGFSNLDELQEGDRVGVMRSSAGKMHIFVNGLNQGVACDRVREPVWGVVDLYGMAVKVSIVDSKTTIPSGGMNDVNIDHTLAAIRPIDDDSLLFHTLRDSDVVITNNGKTAYRPNAHELFSNGVVMTNRTLKTNELFQVRIDKEANSWAGSIEIGVTQHLTNDIVFPFKMSNCESGSWILTGEDVVRNSSVIIPQYAQDLVKLREGDSLGVTRKENGILHFYINGVDQGIAAFNVPEHVFGVVDLTGRVSKVTIISNSPREVELTTFSLEESAISRSPSESNGTLAFPRMTFHEVHGPNIKLHSCMKRAERCCAERDFTNALLFSARPLRECELFEVNVDREIEGCFEGGLEIGVMGISPSDLLKRDANGEAIPLNSSISELRTKTCFLAGCKVTTDGEVVHTNYPLNLDLVSTGDTVGLMKNSDNSVHYTLNGVDQGKAFDWPFYPLYVIVDMSGEISQISIGKKRTVEERIRKMRNKIKKIDYSSIPHYVFAEFYGGRIFLSNGRRMARRRSAKPVGGLCFSHVHLRLGEPIQLQILARYGRYRDTLCIGLTDLDIFNVHVNAKLPPSIRELPHFVTYVDGFRVMRSVPNGKEHVKVCGIYPPFRTLRVGDVITLLKTEKHTVEMYLNSLRFSYAFRDVPDKVFMVADLNASVTILQIAQKPCLLSGAQQLHISDVESEQQRKEQEAAQNVLQSELFDSQINLENAAENYQESNVGNAQRLAINKKPFSFHEHCGTNIRLLSSNTVAERTCGYNHGTVFLNRPLKKGQTCFFRIDKVEKHWYGSLMLGAATEIPKGDLPDSAMELYEKSWVLDCQTVNIEGTVMTSKLGSPLSNLTPLEIVGLHFSNENMLEFVFDDVSIGTFAKVPENLEEVYPLIDLYGKVTQVSILIHTYRLHHTLSSLSLFTEQDRSNEIAENASYASYDSSCETQNYSESSESEGEEIENDDLVSEHGEIEETYPDSLENSPVYVFKYESFVEDYCSPKHSEKEASNEENDEPTKNFLADFTDVSSNGDFSSNASYLGDVELYDQNTFGVFYSKSNKKNHKDSSVPHTNDTSNSFRLAPTQSADQAASLENACAVLNDEAMQEYEIENNDQIPETYSEVVERDDETSDYISGKIMDEIVDNVFRDDIYNERENLGAGAMSLECIAHLYKGHFTDRESVPPTYDESEKEIDCSNDSISDCVQFSRGAIKKKNKEELSEDEGDKTGVDIPDNDDYQLDHPHASANTHLPYINDIGEVAQSANNNEQITGTGQDPELSFLNLFTRLASVNVIIEDLSNISETTEELPRLNDVPAQLSNIVEITEEFNNISQFADELPIVTDITEQIPNDNGFDQLDIINGIEELPNNNDTAQSSNTDEIADSANNHTPNNDASELPVGNDNTRLSDTTEVLIINESIETPLENYRPVSPNSNELIIDQIFDPRAQVSNMLTTPRTDRLWDVFGSYNEEDNDNNPESASAMREEFDLAFREACFFDEAGPNSAYFRQNELYLENNQDIDENLLREFVGMDINNWNDLPNEQALNDNALNAANNIEQELQAAERQNSNFNYLKNLIFCEDELEYRVDYESDAENKSIGPCEYLHSVLKYWRNMVPGFSQELQSIMWGIVKCHCRNCDSNASSRYAGWIRIERKIPPANPNVISERTFWNVDNSLIHWALLSEPTASEQANNSRPSCLHIMPSSAPYFSSLWYDEEHKPLRVSIAIELDINRNQEGHLLDPREDRMIALLLRLDPFVPNFDEGDDEPTEYPDIDFFDLD